jgi:hypothetical protein
MPLVYRHPRGHCIPRHVRDDRDTPLLPARNDGKIHQFLKKRNKKIKAIPGRCNAFDSLQGNALTTQQSALSGAAGRRNRGESWR